MSALKKNSRAPLPYVAYLYAAERYDVDPAVRIGHVHLKVADLALRRVVAVIPQQGGGGPWRQRVDVLERSR
jgi:hypothetical protein